VNQFDQQSQLVWQRVSPLSIIFLLITSSTSFIRQQIFSAGPLLVAAAYISDNKTLVIGAGLALLATLMIVRSILFYFFFTYRLEDDQIIVRQGVFNRENINLQYDRIQNVNVSTPFYYQPFGLVNCQLDSAGSQGSEVVIPGTTQDFAKALSSLVLRTRKGETDDASLSESVDAEDKPETSSPILTLSPFEAAKAGFINARVLVFAGLIAAFGDNIANQFNIDVDAFFDSLIATLPTTGPLATLLFYIAAFSVIAIVLLFVSAMTSLVQNYRFELHKEHQRIRRVTGLTERHETALRIAKVQGITVRQNIRAKMLQRVVVQFHQIGGHNADAGDGGRQNFNVPVLPQNEWHEIVQLAYPDFPDKDSLHFEGVHPGFAIRNFVLFGLLPIVLFSSITTHQFGVIHLGWIGLLPAHWWLCRLRWKRYGYWRNDTYAIVRRGLFGIRHTIFEIRKTQQVYELQTPMQARQNLRDMGIQLAFGSIRLPWIQEQSVRAFLNYTLATVERSNQKWF
jgi:putative membrane protein